MRNEKKTDPATTEILLAMPRRKLCQDAIDNDHMEPPFAILTTDKYGSIASEHSIAVDAEASSWRQKFALGGRQDVWPFDMLLTDARKRTKGRKLNFI